MPALMDKKRTSHVIIAAALDTWSRIAGLNTLSSFLKGLGRPKTLLEKLRTPPTRQDTGGGPNRSPADRGKPPPKNRHPLCPTPDCGNTNHRPEDCLISYPEKAEEYRRRFKKCRCGQCDLGGPLSHRRPSIRGVYEATWKSAYVQHIELQDEEIEVLRGPRPWICRRTWRGIILQAQYQLDKCPQAGPYLLQSLIDTGCEILGVIGRELIDKKYCEAADVQFSLLGAGNMELGGRKLAVRVTILLPVHTCAGLVVARCVNVFLHVASVGSRVILGYPFLTPYGLALLASQGQLAFEEELMWTTHKMTETRGEVTEFSTSSGSVHQGIHDMPIAHMPIHVHGAFVLDLRDADNSVDRSAQRGTPAQQSEIVGKVVISKQTGVDLGNVYEGPCRDSIQTTGLALIGWPPLQSSFTGDQPPLGGAQPLRNDMCILVQALVLISYFLAFTYRSQSYCQVPPQASCSIDGLSTRQKCQNMTVIGRIEEPLTSKIIR